MTGGGAPGAPGIIRCLREWKQVKIIVADARENVAGEFLGDVFVQVPPAGDPGFINAIISICTENKIDLILPLVTKELSFLANAIPEINATDAKVLISNSGSLDIANDKGKLYQFLQWRGLPVPAFRIVENIEQLESAAADLGHPGKPVVVKPCLSNGSRGVRILDERINKMDLLFNHKPGSPWSDLDSLNRILVSGTFPPLLVSEYLPGEEYSVDCIADNGKSLLIVPRLRKKMIGGISVEGEFIEHKPVIEYCRKIIEELKLDGNIGIQVKGSETNEQLILEINPRVQGTVSAALGAGINLPLLAIKQKLGLPVNNEELSPRWGTKFIRVWDEIFY